MLQRAYPKIGRRITISQGKGANGLKGTRRLWATPRVRTALARPCQKASRPRGTQLSAGVRMTSLWPGRSVGAKLCWVKLTRPL